MKESDIQQERAELIAKRGHFFIDATPERSLYRRTLDGLEVFWVGLYSILFIVALLGGIVAFVGLLLGLFIKMVRLLSGL